MNSFKKPLLSWILTAAGWLCIGLSVVGIFLPLLPTVPLLLLASACFARSSPRCYAWLLDHPRLGPLVIAYRDGEGIPLRAKVLAIVMLWISASLSLLLTSPSLWISLVLFGVVTGVTLYLLRLPTCSEN